MSQLTQRVAYRVGRVRSDFWGRIMDATLYDFRHGVHRSARMQIDSRVRLSDAAWQEIWERVNA